MIEIVGEYSDACGKYNLCEWQYSEQHVFVMTIARL